MEAAGCKTVTLALHARRREFWSSFALQDQKEGMAAFIEKRKPVIHDS